MIANPALIAATGEKVPFTGATSPRTTIFRAWPPE
jgi:hypothetical protein